MSVYTAVSIDLDKPRTLLCTWGAVRRIRDRTGLNITKGFAEDQFDELLHIPIFLTELLRHEEPSIQTEWVEDHLLGLTNVEYVSAKIQEAIIAGTPAAQKLAAQGGAEGAAPLESPTPAPMTC